MEVAVGGAGGDEGLDLREREVADAGDAGGSAACHGIFSPGECTTCLEASCCAEIAACTADSKCFACFTGQVGLDECHAPSTEAALQEIIGCQGAKCAEACTAKDTCNPVTNDGCPVQGSSCDLGGSGTFECFPPPNTAALCAACTPKDAVFCAAGATCLYPVGKCARYCCGDADCGSGKCWLDAVQIFGAALALPADAVGVCVAKIPGAGETPDPACDAPAQSPSGGACVGGYAAL